MVARISTNDKWPDFTPPAHFADDPVAQDYEVFFGLLDFNGVPERDEFQAWPGWRPQPERAYVKAALIMIRQKLTFHTELRDFLVQHPALVLVVGFHPVVDEQKPYGFEAERTVPSARHLGRKLQTMDNTVLKRVLGSTVADLQREIPDLGETVSQDVKHIYAWVKENNPKAYVKDRYDPERQPAGDPDCRLGVKRSSNQGEGDTDERKEYLWGYGTGICATKHPVYGEFALAEWTQTFNTHDVTYFHALQTQTETHLEHPPRNLAADAAFDAWYAYEPFAQAGGIAAIPLNLRGHSEPQLGPNGFHLCQDGREMAGSYQFIDRVHDHPAQVERCPLLFPLPTGEQCGVNHQQFQKRVGCVKHLNLTAGARMRVQLDHHSSEYKAIYKQRTASERIFSQAKALGIERPRLRNFHAVQNRNTLIYIVINAKALQRVRIAKAPSPT